ncbi:MAG: hypothetical protein FVQ79_01800 [Planctomycetes bacterium]|nr:hypothetical protein [Planctomycetota bacterium]
MPYDLELLERHPDCILINRYIENPEMFYLYSLADFVYSFYTQDTNRPSGIFRIAVQLKKHVIVRRGSFLHKSNQEYEGLVPVDGIDEFNQKCLGPFSEITCEDRFDDSKVLLNILDSD